MILLEASRSKSKACPLPGLRPTFPRFAGEGTAIVAANRNISAVASPAKRGKLPEGVKGALLIFERQSNRFQHVVQPQQYFIIPEPQHAKTSSPDAGVALCIRAGHEVLAAVEFHYQACLDAGEIGDIGADGMLPAETVAVQSTPTQVEPEPVLRVRHALAKIAGTTCACGGAHR